MSNKRTPADSRVKVSAQFRLDADGRMWLATSLQAPKLTAKGIDIRQARSRLASMLQEHHGQPIAVQAKFLLPRDLEEEFEAYNRDREHRDELTESLNERFVPLANRLLIEGRLQQGQIAEMLGVSSAWLGSRLKADGTSGEVTKPKSKSQR